MNRAKECEWDYEAIGLRGGFDNIACGLLDREARRGYDSPRWLQTDHSFCEDAEWMLLDELRKRIPGAQNPQSGGCDGCPLSYLGPAPAATPGDVVADRRSGRGQREPRRPAGRPRRRPMIKSSQAAQERLSPQEAVGTSARSFLVRRRLQAFPRPGEVRAAGQHA